jgi:ABC-type multidrug transport system fused ATPase/permease subunit
MRERIGMVLQDTWFFSGTIFENINLRVTRLLFLSLEPQPAMIFIISLLPLHAKLGCL